MRQSNKAEVWSSPLSREGGGRVRRPGRAAALAFAGALSAFSVLAACGGSGSTGGTTTNHSDIKLVTVTASTTQNAFQEMANGSRAAAQKFGVSLKELALNGIDPA